MTAGQQVITIAICALGTMATRFLPFLIFREGKPVPKYIRYLGNALPAAIFGMLVVYCLKNVDFLSGNHGIAEIVGIAATGLTHLAKGQMLYSILAGTVCYMVMVQVVF